MSDKLGPVTLAASYEPAEAGEPRPYSEDTARLIDAEIGCVLEDSYRCAVRRLMEHRAQLDALTAVLVGQETLDRDDSPPPASRQSRP